MNKIEKLCYNIVKNNPKVKFLIRNIYQDLFDCLPKQKNYFVNRPQIKENYFFGFHDVTPFSFDDKKILANHLVIPLRMPLKNDCLEVGYFDFNEGLLGDYHKIDNSYSWNYHKGCRLQWLNNESVIFNTALNNRFVSKIVEIKNRNERIVDYPIDAIAPNGDVATSFSYERLSHLMPGYGYEHYLDDALLKENAPNETGIFLIDIKKNSRLQLLSLAQLAQEVDPDIKYRHFVTHSEFSLDSKYVSFLHRWVGDDTSKLFSRMIVYSLESNTFLSLPTSGMVSHYVWNQKNEMLAYCSVDNLDAHVLFKEINTDLSYEIIRHDIINSDGHQHFLNSNVFVTDTYPDRRRMSKIYKVDMNKNEINILAKVYSPKKYQTREVTKHIACDLHPRMSHSSKYICFDTVFTGVRSLCIMSV